MEQVENKRDYYEVLGVSKEADSSAIKKAYRKLAKKYHPDTNAGNAEAEKRFKEISEAYAVLGDEEKKKLYDEFGHIAFEPGFNADAARAQKQYGYENFGSDNSQNGYREYHFNGSGGDDIFGDLFGNMFRRGAKGGNFHSEGFHNDSGFYQQFHQRENDGFYGKHGFHETYSGKGENLEAEISLTFDEAVFGCDKMITLQEAGGNRTLKVHIPAGIDTGQSVRLRGKGHPGIGGGEPGDLLLKAKVGRKPGYERKGVDVYTTVSIPYTTAALGGETRVSTLYGDVSCKIKEGTQSGSKIRLRADPGAPSPESAGTPETDGIQTGLRIKRADRNNFEQLLLSAFCMCCAAFRVRSGLKAENRQRESTRCSLQNIISELSYRKKNNKK